MSSIDSANVMLVYLLHRLCLFACFHLSWTILADPPSFVLPEVFFFVFLLMEGLRTGRCYLIQSVKPSEAEAVVVKLGETNINVLS